MEYVRDHQLVPSEPRIIGKCMACGDEIYDGDEVYVDINGVVLHMDIDCVMSYYQLTIKDAREVIA